MCEPGLVERIWRACMMFTPAACLVSACEGHLVQGVALAPNQTPMVGTAVNLEVSGYGGGAMSTLIGAMEGPFPKASGSTLSRPDHAHHQPHLHGMGRWQDRHGDGDPEL